MDERNLRQIKGPRGRETKSSLERKNSVRLSERNKRENEIKRRNKKRHDVTSILIIQTIKILLGNFPVRI